MRKNFLTETVLHTNKHRQPLWQHNAQIKQVSISNPQPVYGIVFLDFKDTNTLLNTHLNVPSIPSLGLIISPNNNSQKIFLDSILEEESEISDLLQYILSKQYLNNCPAPRKDSWGVQHDKAFQYVWQQF